MIASNNEKSMNCKISNIKFCIIYGKTKAKKTIFNNYPKNQLPQSKLQSESNRNQVVYCRSNAFIPKTHMKSLSTLTNGDRKFLTPLKPAEISLQKFPQRKCLSANRVNKFFMPIHRQKIYSFTNIIKESNPEKIDVQRLQKANTSKQNRKSCMGFMNRYEKPDQRRRFKRYAHTSYNNFREVTSMSEHKQKADFDDL